MSIKNTILDNLKTSIEGINKTSGYNTTVNKVARSVIPIDQMAENCPFVAVLEDRERMVCRDDTNVRFLLAVYLQCFTKVPESDQQEDVTKLGDDIKTLFESLDLGSYCLSADIIETDLVQVEESTEIGGLIFSIEITYYAPKASY